jgi:hypothetical protein
MAGGTGRKAQGIPVGAYIRQQMGNGQHVLITPDFPLCSSLLRSYRESGPKGVINVTIFIEEEPRDIGL